MFQTRWARSPHADLIQKSVFATRAAVPAGTTIDPGLGAAGVERADAGAGATLDPFSVLRRFVGVPVPFECNVPSETAQTVVGCWVGHQE